MVVPARARTAIGGAQGPRQPLWRGLRLPAGDDCSWRRSRRDNLSGIECFRCYLRQPGFCDGCRPDLGAARAPRAQMMGGGVIKSLGIGLALGQYPTVSRQSQLGIPGHVVKNVLVVGRTTSPNRSLYLVVNIPPVERCVNLVNVVGRPSLLLLEGRLPRAGNQLF